MSREKAIRYDRFFRAPQREIAPLYLFVGADWTRVEEGVARLRKEAERLWSGPVELSWIDAEADAPLEGGSPRDLAGRLQEELGGDSLFAGARMTVVRRAQSAYAAIGDFLDRWAASPPKRTSLILWMGSAPAKSRGVAVEFHRLYATPPPWMPQASAEESELVQWIRGRAQRRHAKRMDPADALALIDAAGEDVDLLAREIETLSLYVGSRERISAEDVAALVGTRRSGEGFALAEALSSADARAARAELRQILDLGLEVGPGKALQGDDAAIPLVAAISRFAWDAARAQEAAAEGALTDERLKEIGIAQRPRQASIRRALTRRPPADFARWLQLLAKADLDLKTGKAKSPGTRLEILAEELLEARLG